MATTKRSARGNQHSIRRRRQKIDAGVIATAYTRLQVRNRVLERLIHLFSDLSDPNRVLQELMDVALVAIPCEAGSMLLTQGEKGELSFVAARGPVAHRLLGMTLKRGQGFAGASAVDRTTITVSDVARDPRHAREISEALGFTTTSLLASPIIHQGDVLGVIELVNKKEDSVFPLHEIELVERITRTAGLLLHLMDTLE